MAILSPFFNRMQQIICVLVRSHRQTHAMGFLGGDYDKRRARRNVPQTSCGYFQTKLHLKLSSYICWLI